ncbi:MAG TPA: hypothetical protein PKD54_12235, partial [Pirellulaceae bacterium]|nr:hypothetical protein [Pirellulaceae bacterium]
MRGELVSVTTRDFVRLHGFYAGPSSSSQRRETGVVLVHGLGGNFYGSPLLTAITQHLRDSGFDTLMANTRGHDLLNWTACAGRSRVLGSSTENVADASADLAAWAAYLQRQGC